MFRLVTPQGREIRTSDNQDVLEAFLDTHRVPKGTRIQARTHAGWEDVQ